MNSVTGQNSSEFMHFILIYLFIFSLDQILQDRERDPEDVLASLGFGSSESDPNVSCRVPDRFLTSNSKAAGISIETFTEHNPEFRDYVMLTRTMSQEAAGASGEDGEGHGQIQGQFTVKGHMTFKCLQDLIGYLIDMNVPERFLESCQETFKDLPFLPEDLQPIAELEWDHVTDIGQGQDHNELIPRDESILSLLADHVVSKQPTDERSPNEAQPLANRNDSNKSEVPNYNTSLSEPIASQIFTNLCSEAIPEIPTMHQETATEQIFADLCSNVIHPELSQESIKTLTNSNQNLTHINRSTSYYAATSNSVSPEFVLTPTASNSHITSAQDADIPQVTSNHLPRKAFLGKQASLDYVVPYNQPPPYVRPPPAGENLLCDELPQCKNSIPSSTLSQRPLPTEQSPCNERLFPDEILSDIPTDEEAFRPDVLTHVRLPTPERVERPGTLNLTHREREEALSTCSGSTVSSQTMRTYYNAPMSPNETLV